MKIKEIVCLLAFAICFVFLTGTAQAYLDGVTVTASSELASREAIHLVDGSGFETNGPDTHDTNGPDGTGNLIMWLADPGDTAPWLVFDLGGVFNGIEMKLWNYNEPPPIGNLWGIGQAEIAYSTDSDPETATWTVLETNHTFAPGPMDSNTPFGEVIDFEDNDVRLVKLTIFMNIAGITPGSPSNQYVGASEVRFSTPCEPPIGDIAGPDGYGFRDCIVDFYDFTVLADHWLEDTSL